MILSVTKTFEFEAAHFLPSYPGNCGQLHGHSYKLEVEYGIEMKYYDLPDLDDCLEDAMIIDFSTLKKIVQQSIIEILDHQNLNEVDRNNFPYWMPTAENMVVWICEQLKFELKPIELQRIRLWETSTSYAEVRR